MSSAVIMIMIVKILKPINRYHELLFGMFLQATLGIDELHSLQMLPIKLDFK